MRNVFRYLIGSILGIIMFAEMCVLMPVLLFLYIPFGDCSRPWMIKWFELAMKKLGFMPKTVFEVNGKEI